MLAAAVAWCALPPVFESDTTLMVLPSVVEPAEQTDVLAPLLQLRRGGLMSPVRSIAVSRRLRQAVAAELALEEQLSPRHPYRDAEEFLDESVRAQEEEGGVLRITVAVKANPRIPWRRYLLVDPAELASDIAAAYADEIQQFIATSGIDRLRTTRDSLEKRLESVQGELEAADAAALRILQKHPQVTVSGDTAQLFGAGLTAARMRAEASGRSRGLEAALRDVDEQIAETPEVREDARGLARSPALEPLVQQLAETNVDLRLQREVEGKSDGHPDVVAVLEKQRALQEQIQQYSDMVLASRTERINPHRDALFAKYLDALVEKRVADADRDAAAAHLERLDAQIARLPEASVLYMAARRQVEAAARVYEELLVQLETVRTQERLHSPQTIILDRPEPEGEKTGPSIPKIAILAFVACFCLYYGGRVLVPAIRRWLEAPAE